VKSGEGDWGWALVPAAAVTDTIAWRPRSVVYPISDGPGHASRNNRAWTVQRRAWLHGPSKQARRTARVEGLRPAGSAALRSWERCSTQGTLGLDFLRRGDQPATLLALRATKVREEVGRADSAWFYLRVFLESASLPPGIMRRLGESGGQDRFDG